MRTRGRVCILFVQEELITDAATSQTLGAPNTTATGAAPAQISSIASSL